MTKEKRLKIKLRSKDKLKGSAKRPRLSVFKSNKYVYAQLIDDQKAHTIASASGKSAQKVGEEIAKAAAGKKLKEAIFDRGGFKYHGKIKLIADEARKGGLKF